MSIEEENITLKKLNESLEARIKEQESTITELRAAIKELRSVKANLEETLAEIKRHLFGVKSEKTSAEKKTTETDEKKKEIEVKPHTRTRASKSKREDLYKNLPVREVIYPLSEKEKICPWCNSEMEPVKTTFVREELVITPAKIERVRIMQEVYVCPECRKDHDGVFVKAQTPPALFPHSPASESAVAYIMFQKCFMGLTYYRLEAAMKQLGATLPRETMAKWCISSALEYLQPVYDSLHEELLRRKVIHADETTCQVLREDGKTPQSTSYMWIYASGSDGLPKIILYEYQPGRAGVYPQEFLKGFQGLLQCDGYQGYNKVEDVLLVCCMAHCRRKFYEALPVERKKIIKLLDINSPESLKEPEIPEDDLDKYIPAEIGVAYCNKLFYLEREFKNLSPEERKEKRLQQEAPILERFFNWLETLNPVKGSKLETAVNYAQNHRESLQTYLQDGRCELSNNAAERCAKSYAIGRKNSLFHTSVAGAKASSIIYSIVETAKANNLNVYQYLYVLLLYMPGCKNGSEGMEHLMPWSDFIKEQCSGLVDVENITAKDHPDLPK